MAHRKLTIQEQLKGVRAALKSPRTPPQLKEGLRKRERELTRRAPQASRRRKSRSLFGTFLGRLQ